MHLPEAFSILDDNNQKSKLKAAPFGSTKERFHEEKKGNVSMMNNK